MLVLHVRTEQAKGRPDALKTPKEVETIFISIQDIEEKGHRFMHKYIDI